MCHSSAAHNHPDAFGFVLIFQFPLTFFIVCLDHCNVLNMLFYFLDMFVVKINVLIDVGCTLPLFVADFYLGPVYDHFLESLFILFDDIHPTFLPPSLFVTKMQYCFCCSRCVISGHVDDICFHIVLMIL